jgi:hypothetical protein
MPDACAPGQPARHDDPGRDEGPSCRARAATPPTGPGPRWRGEPTRFEYIEDDGSVRAVRSEDVNDYLRETAGVDVTAKMFRTWAATVLACRTLRQAGPPLTAERETRQVVREASELVADRLGNTAAVARASYIHPAIPAAYLRGTLEPPEVPPEHGDLEGAAAWTPEDEAAALSVIRRWAAAAPLGRATHRPRRASAER